MFVMILLAILGIVTAAVGVAAAIFHFIPEGCKWWSSHSNTPQHGEKHFSMWTRKNGWRWFRKGDLNGTNSWFEIITNKFHFACYGFEDLWHANAAIEHDTRVFGTKKIRFPYKKTLTNGKKSRPVVVIGFLWFSHNRWLTTHYHIQAADK